MILTIADPGDAQVSAVCDVLERAGEHVAIVDPLGFEGGFRVRVEARGGRVASTLVAGPTRLELGAHPLVWWCRRPTPKLARTGAPSDRRASLEAALAPLDARWVTRPEADTAARHRTAPWRVAAEAGFEVPATLVTADPDEAVAFADGHRPGQVVVKQLLRFADSWSGPERVDDLALVAERVASAPAETVVQQHVPGDDIRVVVVDGECFPVEFPERDWLLPLELIVADDPTAVQAVHLPERVRLATQRLVAELGLGVAAVDLRRTDDDRWAFLDVDPTPRWLLLEELSGWPVTQVVAERLAALAHDPLSGRSAARR